MSSASAFTLARHSHLAPGRQRGWATTSPASSPSCTPISRFGNSVPQIRGKLSLGLPNLACILLKDESERRNFILQEVAERKLDAF